ncbi:MAG: hypothetical protein V4670_06035 [Bacteroidota bacterium]
MCKNYFENRFILLVIIVSIIISFSLNSCGLKEKKFDKLGWNKRIDGFYVNREYMVNDLMTNHLHKGMSYKNLINLIGEPGNFSDTEENHIAYPIMEDYGWDIDPVESKTLDIELSKDSTIINYKIEHWEK